MSCYHCGGFIEVLDDGATCLICARPQEPRRAVVKKQVVLGRVDGGLLPGMNHKRRMYFIEVEEAVNRIDKIAALDPEGVMQGEYYIDAPP